jgi:hypothetical protein
MIPSRISKPHPSQSEHEGIIMDIKTIWYEISPYIYAAIGVAVILSRGSSTALLCATALVAASSIIFTLRWSNRQGKNRNQLKRRKA